MIVHAHIHWMSSWTACRMCLVAVFCQTDFQSTLGVGGLGHYIWWTRIFAIISFGATSKIMHTAPTHTLFRRCKWKMKLLLKGSQVTCCMTVDNFVVCLQQVQEAKGTYTQHKLTWRQHMHKFFMKMSFHSYIICFSILENYEHTVHCN